MFAIDIENLKALKYHIFFKKTLGLSIVWSKCSHKYRKYLQKKNNKLKYWKFLV